MIDHDARSEEMIARVFDGKMEGLTRDDVLDNITLYWLTNTAISSAQLYWDNAHHPTGGFFDPRGIKIPVAVSVFPEGFSGPPVSFTPFLEDAEKRLTHQYLLTFRAKPPKKANWQRIRLMTEVPNADLVAPGKVWVAP